MSTSEKKGRGRPRSELTLDRIGEKVLTELDRRLGSAREAADIPGTQLVQIAQRYLAYLEKIAQQLAEETEDAPKLTALELIDVPGLPVERRIEILSPYLERLEDTWRAASAKFADLMEELQAKEAERDGSPVPDVS